MGLCLRAARIVWSIAIATCASAAAAEYEVGEEFPPFKAVDAVTGRAIDLAELRGKVVLIDFWATWCGPCRNEIPALKDAHKKYAEKGLVILSISLDRKPQDAVNYVLSQKMTWLHVAEGGHWQTRLAVEHHVKSIPTMYLLDHEGKVVAVNPRGPRLVPAIETAIAAMPADGGASDDSSGPVAKKRLSERLTGARALLEKKEYGAAADAFEQISGAHPEAPEGKTAAAALAAMMADEEIARAVHEYRRLRGLEREVREAENLLEMARSLVRQKLFDSAKKYYTRLIDKHPTLPQAKTAREEMDKLPE